MKVKVMKNNDICEMSLAQVRRSLLMQLPTLVLLWTCIWSCIYLFVYLRACLFVKICICTDTCTYDNVLRYCINV